MTNIIRIAVDGPASSGKSTVSKLVAEHLHITYLDTGAMYRTATLVSLDLQTKDSDRILSYLQENPIHFEKKEIFLGSRWVTEVIREPKVTSMVSEISAQPEIRTFMVSEQRRIAEGNSIIMDGRDIGTVVLPHAELKIFLIADVHERAVRRHKENLERGIKSDLAVLEAEIIARDEYDSNRKVSPLKAAEDAIIYDTTGRSIEEVVNFIEDKTKALM